MTRTFRLTLLAALLHSLLLLAGCQNQTADLEQPEKPSASPSEKPSTSAARLPRSEQPPPAVLQQVTLAVTGMS